VELTFQKEKSPLAGCSWGKRTLRRNEVEGKVLRTFNRLGGGAGRLSHRGMQRKTEKTLEVRGNRAWSIPMAVGELKSSVGNRQLGPGGGCRVKWARNHFAYWEGTHKDLNGGKKPVEGGNGQSEVFLVSKGIRG